MATASPAAAPRKTVAKLARFKPTVNYKRKAELTWLPVETQLELEQHDSVQTQSEASAVIRYSSGSTLTLQENTLVVIDEDQRPRRLLSEDRAYVGTGSVQGRTGGELWILTSAGLVRLKAKTKNSPAIATVSADRKEGFKILLNEGEAAFLRKTKTGEIATQVLIVNQEVTLPPTTEKPEWNLFSKVAKTSSVTPEEIQKIELMEPKDQTVLDTASVRVSGRLTRPGGKILVNGKSIAPTTDGSFNADVGLRLGANVISIQLIRVDGTTEFKRVTVLQRKAEQKK